MRMTEIPFEGARPVDGYAPGGFRVGGVWLPGSLLLAPGWRAGWSVTAPGGVTPESLARVIASAGEIDVLLLGMGAGIARIPAAAREALEAAGIGAEPMSTPAACRTYNVLLAEGRRIAAALIAV